MVQPRGSLLLQVHGHDMSCLAYIPASSCYVSGAEEKVLRVFQAPQAFTQTLAMAHGDPPPRPQASTPHTSQVCPTLKERVLSELQLA